MKNTYIKYVNRKYLNKLLRNKEKLKMNESNVKTKKVEKNNKSKTAFSPVSLYPCNTLRHHAHGHACPSTGSRMFPAVASH
jgi:hypothetical protein